MKQKAINQEILLITGTSLTNRSFCKTDSEHAEGRHYSPVGELEKACWDGMLDELLPGLAGHPSTGNNHFIWNIANGSYSLCLSIGPCPMPEKDKMSIDPYFIQSSLLYS